MTTLEITPNEQTDTPVWKTETYHDHDMHVCTERLINRNPSLSGHGNEWTFTVTVSLRGANAQNEELVSAKADLGLFYASQAIAEGMGFLRGRELIEAR
ncbi:hypothetical protein [Methyloversatilis sp.]|uniref:hypothetical protein n=1 Tax=Methyloversatilis sp. TaxID=2569862 RepID=UPI0027374C7F|nr:hypothetical protein [Methyloversatilis sp.]MDP2870782.1 hypothetical protein [Methyloversatilis sp.]MDP3287994.1 hypothetical protein [Methyloversatilis sp.]MDP3456241.1 hypothetical protein [Methyloversatilis sp.]MDP3579374.1 hypothetical protein [Methyloversatilis sp.]